MSARSFVDTNVLVYARDSSEKVKQPVAEALVHELWKNRAGCVSVQVLNEYFVTVTQKLKPGLSSAEAWSDLEALKAWPVIPLRFSLLERAYNLQSRYSVSWWDGLIISAAIEANCHEILSEDLSAGQSYDGVTVVNPFACS